MTEGPTTMATDNLTRLAEVIRQGFGPFQRRASGPLLEGVFGERFQRRHLEPSLIRDAYALARTRSSTACRSLA